MLRSLLEPSVCEHGRLNPSSDYHYTSKCFEEKEVNNKYSEIRIWIGWITD